MAKQDTNLKEYYTIDLLHIFKFLWQKVWMVAIASFLAAVIGFSVAAFLIAPTYSSSVMLYVNNSSFSLGNTSFSISSSEITAAQSLVKTYREILMNRTTLNLVIDKADVSYDYKELFEMLEAEPSNDTEIMRVTVTAEDPKEASKIANCIAEVLPDRINDIIEGATMEVVDYAIPNGDKVAPSVTKYTAVGLILGALLSIIAIVIAAIMDDTIHDEEYVLNTYNYPILAKVPNLLGTSSGRYDYYYQSKRKAKD